VRRYDLPDDFEIVEEADHWSNGLIVSSFRAHGVVFRVSRSDGTREEDGFYTYLRPADDGPYRGQKLPPWLLQQDVHSGLYYFPTLPGTIEPDMAAAIIDMIKKRWEAGEAVGRQRQQADFRKVIGVK
jgi:hypothetical protein